MSPEDLRSWRKARGLTQKQLAADVGVTIITIKRYEKGTYPIPKLLVLYTEAN